MASQRHLAAIMFTDMVGFTQGTQLDERSSLRRLEEQEELVRPIIASHQGRVVKSTGDGLLVEFPSALKATQCAAEIQRNLRDRNLKSTGPPIELRIGIHLGDVEERGDDILGDAVNLAARVQGTAEAGGIAVSQQVYDQVGNKLDLRFEPLPPQKLKGVQTTVVVFRVLLPWSSAGTLAPAAGADRSYRLAVLPFHNISPDPQDAYFSDGLTEEVITVLSELKELRVIARTSVDPYRSAPRPVAQVGQELGVRWVLEGSVRKAGPRLRFNAQLVDTQTQEPVWTGRYDRELTDIFELQSELAKQIADALKITLLIDDSNRILRRPAPKPESYLEYLQGRSCLRDVSESSLREAKAHFERAIVLDERNASAYAGLAEAIGFLSSVYRTMTRVEAMNETRRLAARALELNPNLAEVHTLLASNLSDDYDFEGALREIRIAIDLNPSYAVAHLYGGALLADVGQPDAALQEYSLAEQLDPLSPLLLGEQVAILTDLGRLAPAQEKLQKLGEVEHQGLLYHDRRGLIALVTGNYDDYRTEMDWLQQHFPDRPEFPTARAMYHALTGDRESARRILAEAEDLPEMIRPSSQIASVYAVLGDLDQAFRWMNTAIDDGRFAPRAWLYAKRAESVRKDPRFAEVLRRVHVPVP